MRAVTFTAFGGPDVLTISDLPTPGDIADDHVRIRVHAAAVHPLDLVARSGYLGPMLPAGPTYVLGADVAGTVDAVGSTVSDFSIDQPVIAMSDWPDTKIGTQAEFVVLPAASLAPSPDGVSFEAAATLPLNAHTAAQALTILGLGAGDSIAVTGAAGGVGGFAVQIALHRGLRVIAIAGPEDEPFLTALGADFVPRGGDPAGAVRAIVPNGVDGLVDTATVGSAVMWAVRDGGSFVAVTPPTPPPPERGIRVGLVLARADGVELTELSGLVERGNVTLRVAKAFPFERAAEAHAVLAEGGVRGGLVLVANPEGADR